MNGSVKDASYVEGVGDDCDVSLRLNGKQMYVRKCRTGERYDDDSGLWHIDGIILPDSDTKIWKSASETCMWVEILGWGPKCIYDWKVGALAHVAGHVRSEDARIQRSPYCFFEFFISEELDKYDLPIFDFAFDPDDQ